ncbi:hypothetical protein DFH28DRAFT_1078772 [Melampsora americana]|nr:hypothetical protein DFH28DRAFT_1078772 [Melampsora americana]
MSSRVFNKPTCHGLYFLGNFEIQGKISSNLSYPSKDRTDVVYINCGSADRNKKTCYEIRAIGLSPNVLSLRDKQIYSLQDHALVGVDDKFQGETIDTLGVLLFGTVVKLQTIDDTEHLETIVLTVEHTDYHPSITSAPIVPMEYHVRPYKYLPGAPRILNLGCKCLFHRYLKDFNKGTSCYIVIANGVLTSNKVVKTKLTVDTATCSKPKRYRFILLHMGQAPESFHHEFICFDVRFVPRAMIPPFQSPIFSTTPAADIHSGPDDYPSCSPLELVPGNKRPWARLAKQTSSNSTLDLS